MLVKDVWSIFIIIYGHLALLGFAGNGDSGRELKAKRNFSSKQIDRKNVSEYYRVNSNIIIRTQDSRALGAKYLNETELPTNEDCLYWCFETKNCNVAVYKEKDKKSCYLFDCGSHNDFRCMFTQHTFYTSSILHSSHHSHDLSEWGIQEKHEHDLSHLHLMSTNKPLAMLPSNSHPTYQPEAPEVTTKPDTITTSKSQEMQRPSQEMQCRHYQFRCQNSSDCIAIYNVCDGIPQCPDGSDESSDLHCPNSDNLGVKSNAYAAQDARPLRRKENQLSPLATTAPAITDYGQLENTAGKIASPANSAYPAAQDNSQWGQNYQQENGGMGNRHQLQQAHEVQHPFSHKHSNFVAANSNNYHHVPYPNAPSQWQDYYDSYNANQPPPQPDYQEYANNFQPANGRYQKVPHPPENSHYHPHQENGYYPPPMESPNYSERMRPDDRTMHNKPLFAEGQPYQQNQWSDGSHSQYHSSHLPESNVPSYLPKQQSPYNANSQPHPLPNDHQPPLDASNEGMQKFQPLHTEYQIPNAEYQETDQNLYQPIVDMPVHSSAQPAQTHDPGRLSTDYNAKKRKQEVENDLYHAKEHSSSRQINIPNVSMTSVELQESIVKHAEESNSAVLALTLGLCVTAVLLILVGCRMRSIRRRLARRKRSALVHDADYLVNGMYL